MRIKLSQNFDSIQVYSPIVFNCAAQNLVYFFRFLPQRNITPAITTSNLKCTFAICSFCCVEGFMAFVPKFLVKVVQIIWSYGIISNQKLFSFKGHKVNSFVGLMGKRSQEEPGKLNSHYRKPCTCRFISYMQQDQTRQCIPKLTVYFPPRILRVEHNTDIRQAPLESHLLSHLLLRSQLLIRGRELGCLICFL